MVAVKEGDLTVSSKKRLSAFYPTDLEFLWRSLKRNTLIMTGLMTDCCVLNSCFDASNRGFKVIAPRDLSRGFNQELEDAALKIISLHLGLVVDSGDLVSRWIETA